MEAGSTGKFMEMHMFGGGHLWRFDGDSMGSKLHWFLWWVASCTVAVYGHSWGERARGGDREGETEREVSGASLANLDHERP